MKSRDFVIGFWLEDVLCMDKKRQPICKGNLITRIDVGVHVSQLKGFRRAEVGLIGVPYSKVMRVQTHALQENQPNVICFMTTIEHKPKCD